MSFQAYLDKIKTKTGKGPADFKKLAEKKGFLKKGKLADGVKAGEIVQWLKDDFELLSVEGLCSIVPPSYIEGFAEKHPAIYAKLKALEDRYKSSWPWKNIGDYYIITLRKK